MGSTKKIAWTVGVVAGCLAGLPASANDELQQLKQQVEALQKRIQTLEQQQSAEKAAATPQTKAAPAPTISQQGFGLKLGDGSDLRVRGFIQANSRFYEDTPGATDTFVIRRARFLFDGTFARYYAFRLTPSWDNTGSGNTAAIQDAFIEANFSEPFRIRVGKFTGPVGLEALQLTTALSFAELGFPNGLIPNRDIGVQVFGNVLNGTTLYTLGVFNGTVDGASADLDNNNGKEVVLRLFAHPFKNSANRALTGLGAGFAFTHGTQSGDMANPNLPSFRSPGRQTFFAYTAGAYADGTRQRLMPQFYYYNGPFGLLGEYVTSQQEITRAGAQRTIENAAWQLQTSWVMSGGKASFTGVVPDRPFDLQTGNWGAFEWVARYAEHHNDDVIFLPGPAQLADPTQAARSARDFGLGLSWYFNRFLKAQLSYDWTRFEGGAIGGDRPDEQVLFTHIQLGF
jgi:phosphate-selective porin OprO/OprP